jgi:hypothetical protein
MYRYNIDFSMVTADKISFWKFSEYYQNNDEAKQALYDGMQGRLPSAIVEAFAEQGETVSVVSSEIVNFEMIPVGWHGYDLVLRVNAKAVIETQADYFKSPIAPLVILAIAKAIALIVLAVAVPLVIGDWLKSMSTESWTVEKYDAEGNLVSRESGTKPSGEGMFMLIIGVVIILVVLMFFQKGKGGG